MVSVIGTLLGLGLSSVMDTLELLDLDQKVRRGLGSDISRRQDKLILIFRVRVFHHDRVETDGLDVLGGTEGDLLGCGGPKGSCARYWRRRGETGQRRVSEDGGLNVDCEGLNS